ncbi:MAG: hypothetical protein WD688_22005 [Candidatus Binatia bacterium]
MNWLEIPAHRVLEVERNELMNEFDMYDEAGTKLCGTGRVYLLFRKKDGKRFKFAQFGDLHGAIKGNRAYLQEV